MSEQSDFIPGVTQPPPRYLEDKDQWSPDDFWTYAKHGTKPKNPEYEQFRREALQEAGLDPDDDGREKSLADLEAADPESLTAAELYRLSHGKEAA
jgi:hypothetical protein